MENIGRLEEFHSVRCYNLYLYAIKFASKINEYLDAGYMIFDDDGHNFSQRFSPRSHKDFGCTPSVYVLTENSACNWIQFSRDDNGKVWIAGLETKTSIKDKFASFKIVNPKHIKKIRF